MNRRANGFGSLIFKGEGRPWLARWVYKGQVYYRTTGEPDKKKALKKLEYITRPYREKRAIDVERNLLNRIRSLQENVSKEKLLITDLWTVFAKKLKNDDVTGSTEKCYEGFVNVMVDWMKKRVKHVNDITQKIAEEYLEHLASTVGATTYNIRLVLFKRIWKALSNDYMMDADVWENFKKKKVAKTSRRTVNNFEIGKVLAKADTFDMKLLLTIGIYTGLRISDCALLKWCDVDIEHKIIRTIPIKTRKHMDAPVEIPIHPTLLKMLEDALYELSAAKLDFGDRTFVIRTGEQGAILFHNAVRNSLSGWQEFQINADQLGMLTKTSSPLHKNSMAATGMQFTEFSAPNGVTVKLEVDSFYDDPVRNKVLDSNGHPLMSSRFDIMYIGTTDQPNIFKCAIKGNPEFRGFQWGPFANPFTGETNNTSASFDEDAAVMHRKTTLGVCILDPTRTMSLIPAALEG